MKSLSLISGCAARSVTAAQKTGGPCPPPPPLATSPDYMYVRCSHCSRQFNEHATERHIPFCKEPLYKSSFAILFFSHLANTSLAKSESLAKRQQVICSLHCKDIIMYSVIKYAAQMKIMKALNEEYSVSQSVIMLSL